MLFLLPILTLPALLSVFFAGFLCPDAHLRFGYLASFTSLVGLPSPHFPGSGLPVAEYELSPGFNHSVFAPLAVYRAKSFEVIPHPVLFLPHIPLPNLAQNISSYQPWLRALTDFNDIYIPAQLPTFEAVLDFNLLFILPVIEFKSWLFAHFLGLIALAVCCPYFDLFGCELFPKRCSSLQKKTLPFTPEDPTLTSTYGRPLFAATFGSSYKRSCFLTIPTTRNCLPIQTETADTSCIHSSPSDLELDPCIPPPYSGTYLNTLELYAPSNLETSVICHDDPVVSDRTTIIKAKLEYCTNGFGETSCQNELISPTVNGDIPDLKANNVGLSLPNKSVLGHITIDCDLKAVIKVKESNFGISGVSHSNIIVTEQKYEEPEPPLTCDDTSTNTTIETMQCLSSAVEPGGSEKGYKPSCCIGMKLEQQMLNGKAREAKQNIMNDSADAILPPSLPILMESSLTQAQTAISKTDPVINCDEQTSESESLLKCNLAECEVKVKRKRGCRGGVKVSKRAAARKQAAAKKELECTIAETESVEHDEDLHVTAEDNLLVLDSPNYLIVPLESDTPDVPIMPEIETVEPELQVIKATTPVYIKEGKMFKPGYVRKRGCRGKKKSKRQAQSPCDDAPPVETHSDS